jgi:Fe-S cluster biogenesis protein NfuA
VVHASPSTGSLGSFYYRTLDANRYGCSYNRPREMTEKSDMQSRVEETLDKVRPAMRADGGDARVVACDEESGSVSIQMIGACKGCPLSQLDFVYAIESLIKREVPEVREIVAV